MTSLMNSIKYLIELIPIILKLRKQRKTQNESQTKCKNQNYKISRKATENFHDFG